MFKQRTMMLMMGQRAERLREERIRQEESVKMRKEIRSVRRTRHRTELKNDYVSCIQDKCISRLRSEAIECETDIGVANSPYFQRQDERDSKQLKEWIETNDYWRREIRKTREHLEVLRRAIRETDAEMDRTKKDIARRKAECSTFRVITHEKVLNRLDKATRDFGQQLQENKCLLAEMHHLTVVKALYQAVTKKLETILKKLTLELTAHTECTRATYDQKDNLDKTMVKVRAHYEKQRATFELEMKMLNFKIDVLKRTEAFIVEKNKYREDEFAERRAALLAQLNPVERENLRYRSVIQDVAQTRGTDNIHEVVTTFVQMMEENWMLFKIIDLVKHIVQEAQILSSTGLILVEADEKEARIAKIDEAIQLYIKAVEDIMEKLDYDEEDIKRLAGVFGIIEERNILTLLSEIEAYVNKLWVLQDFIEYKAFEDRRRVTLIPVAVKPKGPRPPRHLPLSTYPIVPPCFDRRDEYDEHRSMTDIRVVPYSHEQIKQYVHNELEARVCSITSVVSPHRQRGSDGNQETETPPQSPVERTWDENDVF
ncbi:hypothetical protein BaRGS_00031772 [Batillaria attramentaria]|uniref:ODAD1 central coiled coil region domain-containing protein n=1 Tax=Batillaria attramentaria TaxID=370345 RepID=A0ABD0JQ36_9CAEN